MAVYPQREDVALPHEALETDAGGSVSWFCLETTRLSLVFNEIGGAKQLLRKAVQYRPDFVLNV